ncbi:MAG: hypothetical protein GWO11_00915 [Desulfuromonadales bacterium]|nr:hypothetical protein [Desulfuromonadales bacterium]NIR33071.1 hypothetical protein [Desulfuromonadales bacterium]NIS39309.1 hypothetical protein [Desulfuromonadales bacterium]
MVRTALFFTLLLSIVFFCPASLLAAGAENAQPPSTSNRLDLPPDLRRLLNSEMTYLQKGMMKLIPAIASADWKQVEKTATNIRDSYIMKKKLSSTQRKSLHRILPPLFKEWDRSFHHHAEEMAHAAAQGRAEIVVFYFNKLSASCVECHSRFAAKRFPGFKATDGGNHH